MKKWIVVVVVCAVASLGTGAPARAHGEKDAGGVTFEFGWEQEPTYAGALNAVHLELFRGGQPVEGAEDTLHVEVSFGTETSDPLKLHPVVGEPGVYLARVIPTVPGGYTFRFSGKVDGETFDESVTAPKDGFDEVQGTSDIAFPKQAPTTTELAEKLASLERDASDAKTAATRARFIGFVGVLIAAAGIGLGFFTRRRA